MFTGWPVVRLVVGADWLLARLPPAWSAMLHWHCAGFGIESTVSKVTLGQTVEFIEILHNFINLDVIYL